MQPLVRVKELVKVYARRRLAGVREGVRALDGVSFSILRGKTFAVVGESGSGKSTLAFCLACLENPTSGSIWLEDEEIVELRERERRRIHTKVQLIFQDPANSLNPRWKVKEILTEPLVLQGSLSHAEIRRRAHALLEQVGLSKDLDERLPSELSGGQRQRLAIARALTLEPRLLILDEALSALDCSVQAQIVNLLVEVQSALGMTYLFISHDLAMAAHLADEVAVMSRGRIVEQGAADRILTQPQSDTARHLLKATPHLDFSLTPTKES